MNRRSFLQMATGLVAASRVGFIGDLLAQERSGRGAKACILLWMSGGPSQLDTFDPKPGTDTGGEFRAIETALRGVKISETLPRLAKEAKRFSIVRSLTTPEGDHGRASFFLHTGYRQREGLSFPPAGSVFSKELAMKVDFPKFVNIGYGKFGPAFLGHEHAAFTINDPAYALDTIQAIAENNGRIDLMNRLEERYEKTHVSDAQARREASIQGLRKLMETPFAKALDLSQEKDELKKAYGETPFGQGCLLARRLVEHGVKFVEVELGSWDTHSDNFNGVRGLCDQLDPAFSTLLQDLAARGLLDETVVLWMGEFGRTPTVNATNGRDHFPDITPAVLAGGPIQGGRVIGGTNANGTAITADPARVPDLFATLYKACGIDPGKKYFNAQGGLVKATDGGTPIRDLL